MGNSGGDRVLGFRNISDRYKNIVLDVLEKVIERDIEDDARGYVKAVKNLARLLQRYMPREYIDKVNEIWQKAEEKVEEIKTSNLSEAVKQKRIDETRYIAASSIFSYLTEIVTSSVVEEELTGTLIIGKSLKDIEEYAKELKKVGTTAKVEIEHYEEESA